MRINANTALEFNVILERLAGHAISEKTKEKLLLLNPFLNETQCKQKTNETTDALKIFECFGTPPLSSMRELYKILELTEKGSMLIPEQLSSIAGFIRSCKQMKSYLKKAELLNIPLGFYGGAFNELNFLYDEIERSIRNERVDDSASSALRDIRRKIENAQSSVKNKLETILRSKKEWFSDGYVATREGRFVLPVKKEYKNQVSGTVIETSGTGGTYFIEPAAVKKLREELENLYIDEENEVRKILYTLTALAEEHLSELKINMECMESLDFAFAKAKLSIEMKAIPVLVTADRKIKIVNGRHPLLKHDSCVPLNFETGGDIRGVVITGPNTGGKTVALKTVGLLSLMAQSGLHIPVSEGSIVCMHNDVLCDIGDGQSITENLSTFSSHITNIIEILKNVTDESLVLLDELGSGTDPAEGMGLAVAILDELRKKNCLFIATTHYPEIKEFAKSADGLINARMEFDRESLKPLYQLQIGEAGESCALYIAQRLGFPLHLLNRARQEAYERNRKSMEKTDLPAIYCINTQTAGISLNTSPTAKIQKEIPKIVQHRSEKFNIGDSVTVYPQKVIGIICKRTNEKGELGVQIKRKKQLINHKRLKLLCSADELYPEDYDFYIIFDTVANRKARRIMNKKHDPNLIITYDEEL